MMTRSARVPEKPQTIRELLAVASGWLSEQGVPEARLDTELLLAHCLGCKRLDLYLDHDRPLEPAELARFRPLMRRRGTREPVAYILGTRGFHGIELAVGPGVLIPRPDTETLVEVALELLDRLQAERGAAARLRCADVGTGSGCVALALASERSDLDVLALERSPQALAFARRNLAAAQLGTRLALVRADLLAPLAPASLDLVVSNPPYIVPDEEGLLAPEVLRHEPHEALFDAPGLPLTQRLAAEARGALRAGGWLALETGFSQGAGVAAILREAGYADVATRADLGGVERVVMGRRSA